MILQYLLPGITLETLMQNVNGLDVDTPEEKDYDPGVWIEMKSKRFISTHEKIKGREGLWQLSFNNNRLFFIQFNIEFGSKSENAYNNCMDICKSIVKINNSIRVMKDFLISSNIKNYMDFKNEFFSETGVPDGIIEHFAYYSWKDEFKSSYLSASLLWPDTMIVEYREEPVILSANSRDIIS